MKKIISMMSVLIAFTLTAIAQVTTQKVGDVIVTTIITGTDTTVAISDSQGKQIYPAPANVGKEKGKTPEWVKYLLVGLGGVAVGVAGDELLHRYIPGYQYNTFRGGGYVQQGYGGGYCPPSLYHTAITCEFGYQPGQYCPHHGCIH